MKKIAALLFAGALVFSVSNCGETVDVEYPVFPKSKEGRQLQKFLGSIRNVGLAVEKPQKSLWETVFGAGSSFIDQMPAKVFEAFDKETYYKLIDLSKRADSLNEATLTLAGITKSRVKLGNQLGAEAILHIGYQKPYTECGSEMMVDYGAAALKVGGAIASMATGKNVDTGGGSVSKQTGIRYMLIPLDATLIKVETGEVKKAVVSNPAKVDAGVGNLDCPSVLDSFGKALDEAALYIKDRLSPKVKTEKIDVFTKDEDPEVAELLGEGYQEITGETPSFKKAKEYWEKADKKAGGKSWGAKANLGTYYFQSGDFEKAIKFYETAMGITGADKKYVRELRKRVEAAAAVDDTEK
ncbi:lipoprotein LipL41 [Leptospira wolffii]|uniref:Lipoprotein LipL41 n=1 Tax=Leptospira wolffii TaxID=409998 RepID=A0ABV5BM11_9LEPT|nr:lipoprotein LipL41 [Leptospira wolffii]TGK62349.1 lipoprotein LipL41 [Leptospira wolffii]TGK68134.1 lipoprotein LipL41 [Leptospira wolffii]TGK74267.1 lipoprotein LipL41 [Leptospira wolffii]TGL32158.1 lipoprotein LipL41 [Leptospira wolffii]TGL49161.1 lipoprotein LipL41 [Leptospira wolffii]